ncbi:MAG: MFS transporter [Pseudomonadota bacterium]
MTASAVHQPATRTLVWGYGAGSIANSAAATIPPLLFLYFLTQIVGAPPAVAGFALLIPQALDFISTPFIGLWADRMDNPGEGRRKLLRLGLIAVSLGFAGIFAVPDIGGWVLQLVLATLIYTVMVFGNSLFAVPYLALPAEMTPRNDERTRFVAARMTFVMIGILVTGSVAQPIVEAFGGGRTGYSALSFVLAVTCALSMAITLWATKSAPREVRRGPRTSVLSHLKSTATYGPFRVICAGYLAQAIGLGCGLGAWPFFATYVVGDESAVAFMFATAMGVAALTTPVWGRISSHLGKPLTYSVGVLLFVAGYGALFLLSNNISMVRILTAMAIAGAGTGALQLVPFAAVADLAREVADREGAAMAASINGLWVAVEKGGFALSGLVLGLMLMACGFAEGGGEQSTMAVRGVVIAATLAPCFFILMSAAVLAIHDEWRRGAVALPTTKERLS